MTDTPEFTLKQLACAAARPDVWSEPGVVRAGMPGALVQFAEEGVQRVIDVVEKDMRRRGSDADVSSAHVVGLEGRVNDLSGRVDDLVTRLGAQAAEYEQANSADRRRMQGIIDTVTESREQAILDRDKEKARADDAEAQMKRMEADLLKARGAKPSGSPSSGGASAEFVEGFLSEIGRAFEEGRRGRGGQGSGPNFEELLGHFRHLFQPRPDDDDENGKGKR